MGEKFNDVHCCRMCGVDLRKKIGLNQSIMCIHPLYTYGIECHVDTQ